MLFSACGVPNLEPAECIESRTALREFYSFHFGNEMKFSPDGLAQRERFLTPSLMNEMRAAAIDTDPFTSGNTDLPKTFRVGECRVPEPGRTRFDLLIFWKDDVRSEQRKLEVDMVKTDRGWLVDRIKR